jgi:diadenosine tetraphosphate (Ap4A) HIT family hydrolase
MMEIHDILHQKWNAACIGCAIGAGEMIPPGGVIAENRRFYMHQDPEIPIPGFLIIAPRRHVHAIVDLTADEYADFASLLQSGRKLLTWLPELRSVTVIQEEHSSHFHLWLFPWYDWMIEKYGKRSLNHIRPIMEYAKTSLNTIQQQQLILESVATLQNAAQNHPGILDDNA